MITKYTYNTVTSSEEKYEKAYLRVTASHQTCKCLCGYVIMQLILRFQFMYIVNN